VARTVRPTAACARSGAEGLGLVLHRQRLDRGFNGNMTDSLRQAPRSDSQLKLTLSSCFVDEKPVDPELDELLSQAIEGDERASLSRDAAALTDVDSPEHRQAAHDSEVSAEAWRKVVARSEQLRRDDHPSN
jgi:hypothetical protein